MVEGALERKAAARADWDDIDWDAAWAAEGEALAAGMALGRDGRIASPRALCRALGVERHVYDGVIRMYADGRPGAGRQPRALRGGLSSAGRVFEVLVASGDRRFESRRLGAELMSAAMGGER